MTPLTRRSGKESGRFHRLLSGANNPACHGYAIHLGSYQTHEYENADELSPGHLKNAIVAYPLHYSTFAYRMGINFIIYALTH